MHLGMHWRGNLHRFFFPACVTNARIKSALAMHSSFFSNARCIEIPMSMHETKPNALRIRCSMHVHSWCIKTLGKTHPLGENAPKKWGEHSIFREALRAARMAAERHQHWRTRSAQPCAPSTRPLRAPVQSQPVLRAYAALLRTGDPCSSEKSCRIHGILLDMGTPRQVRSAHSE